MPPLMVRLISGAGGKTYCQMEAYSPAADEAVSKKWRVGQTLTSFFKRGLSDGSWRSRADQPAGPELWNENLNRQQSTSLWTTNRPAYSRAVCEEAQKCDNIGSSPVPFEGNEATCGGVAETMHEYHRSWSCAGRLGRGG